ncbi:MAG: hypothetical protein PHT58_05490 [Eubacteriales bacterium]|nr:hypothetical protein [Eubacteriales bacterium]
MKKTKITELSKYVSTLSPSDQVVIRQLFLDLKSKICMSKAQTHLLVGDFEVGLMYLLKNGVGPKDAVTRLSADKLGTFYKDEMTVWYPADDGAKIYPLTIKRNWMQMFHLSMYLNDDIEPCILQLAMDFTIKRFPFFATTVKKGFFWHYLDGTKQRYPVLKEDTIPCSSINVSAYGTPPFRIMYYKNRVSLEGFHVVTDGTGATAFLMTLMAEYIRIKHGADIPCTEHVRDISQPAPEEEARDDFHLAEKDDSGAKAGFSDKSALQLRGKMSHIRPHQVIHFELEADKVHALAKSLGATVNTLMLALLILASKESSDGDGRMHFQVPVNMRKFYNTATLRNFSMFCVLRFKRSEIPEFGELLKSITSQLAEVGSREALNRTLLHTKRLVHSLRYIPLYLKWPIAKLIFGSIGDRVFSNTLSNLGVLKVPAQMAPYVQKMDAVLGATIANRVTCTMVTCNNVATFTVTKMTDDDSFENAMLRLLEQKGLTVKLNGSEKYGN